MPPTMFFLDLIELDGCQAESIVNSLLACLEKHGIDRIFLDECLYGFCSDGASVMMGRTSGVFRRLKTLFPRILGWHCINHRLELSVGDAVKSCSAVNHFKSLMDKLYCLYSQSPKNVRELQQVSNELDINLQKIGRILGVRWVASSFRAVHAVWVSYSALYKHFHNASQDESRDSTDKTKFQGLARKLSSSEFLRNLGLLCDALEELKELSEALQARSMTLVKGVRSIRRTIDVLASRKDSMGRYQKQAEEAIDSGQFSGVTLHTDDRPQAKIDSRQFYQSLVDSMNRRMVSVEEEDIFQKIAVLDLNSLPKDISPTYGETEIRWLCEFFRVDHSAVKAEYREFKDTGVICTGGQLEYLKHCTESIAVSSAECERGFSAMNDICTGLRSSLTVKHISNLMLIALVGPPVLLWNPDEYVSKWLTDRRSAEHVSCMKRSRSAVVDKLRNENDYCATIWKLL